MACARELPELEQLRREYEPKGVRFLFLSLEPDEQAVRAAAERLGIRSAVGLADGEVLAPLGVNQVPATVFVDREAVIVAAASGRRRRSSLEARIQELLSP